MDERGAGKGLRVVVAIRNGPEEERILQVFENSGLVEGVSSTLCPGFSGVVFHRPPSGMLAHGKKVCLA